MSRRDAAETHVIPFDPKRVMEIAFSPDCRVNVTDEQLLAQVAENIRRGLPQAMPYDPNPDVAILVAGIAKDDRERTGRDDLAHRRQGIHRQRRLSMVRRSQYPPACRGGDGRTRIQRAVCRNAGA
jgi:hypothetical protein